MILELKKLSKSFGSLKVLKNINLKIDNNECVGIIGPNGAGKSTLFNLLIGLIKPDFGKVIIANVDATNYPIYERAKKFKIGYVPQYGGYFHDLTLIENLKAVGEILIENETERQIKIDNMISKFALDNVRDFTKIVERVSRIFGISFNCHRS